MIPVSEWTGAHPLKDFKTPEYLENNASFPPSQKPCPERRKTHKNLVQTILKYKVFSSNCTLADIKRRKLLIGQKPPPFVNDIANYIDLSEGGNVFTTDGHLLLSVMPSFLDHVYYTKDSATQTYGRGFFQLGNQVYHAESVALGALIALAGSFKKLPQPNDIRHDGYARFDGSNGRRRRAGVGAGVGVGVDELVGQHPDHKQPQYEVE